jgi:hypothetical protein
MSVSLDCVQRLQFFEKHKIISPNASVRFHYLGDQKKEKPKACEIGKLEVNFLLAELNGQIEEVNNFRNVKTMKPDVTMRSSKPVKT